MSTNVSVPITVNGEARTTTEGQTLLGLLAELQLDPARVAIELDRRIVKQPLWPETPVRPGAQIEIVQFVGGG
ncbi:MAG TPA: sulfur carrier protein ThiS [Bryobacteraceae bacterium]|nr:sulfur carrier protein ThiS [Bryobacteraceae bacterium]